MLTYFPKHFSSRAIMAYGITLALVSGIFFSRVLPLQFILFGIIAVVMGLLIALERGWSVVVIMALGAFLCA